MSEYEVDCVIFASGFEISTEISRRYAIEAIVGRDGLSLFEHWQDDYKTLHGMTSRGFPNQFFMGFIQGGVSANTTAMFEQQAEHIAYVIAEAQRRGATTVEPSQQGQDDWVATVRESAIDNSAFELSCTPGYYNNEGRGGAVGNGSFLGEFYAPGFYAFDELIAQWRDNGDLDGPRTPWLRRDSTGESPWSPAGAADWAGPTRCCWRPAGPRSSSTIPAAQSTVTAPTPDPRTQVVREITDAGGAAVVSTDSVATPAGRPGRSSTRRVSISAASTS